MTKDGDPDDIDTVHGESRRQSGGMSTRDGVLQGRDNRQLGDAAITRTYNDLPGVNGDKLSPTVIDATKDMSRDAVEPYQFANSKIEVRAKVIEWENSSNFDPDKRLFSHHHKNDTDMEYSEEHGQSTVMTAETDKLGIDRYNADCNPLEISRGEELRLYLDRFKDEYAPSLAHMWHGPFREADKCGDHIVRLDIHGKAYRLFSMVHVSKLKQVNVFPDRPIICLTVY